MYSQCRLKSEVSEDSVKKISAKVAEGQSRDEILRQLEDEQRLAETEEKITGADVEVRELETKITRNLQTKAELEAEGIQLELQMAAVKRKQSELHYGTGKNQSETEENRKHRGELQDKLRKAKVRLDELRRRESCLRARLSGDTSQLQIDSARLDDSWDRMEVS